MGIPAVGQKRVYSSLSYDANSPSGSESPQSSECPECCDAGDESDEECADAIAESEYDASAYLRYISSEYAGSASDPTGCAVAEVEFDMQSPQAVSVLRSRLSELLHKLCVNAESVVHQTFEKVADTPGENNKFLVGLINVLRQQGFWLKDVTVDVHIDEHHSIF